MRSRSGKTLRSWIDLAHLAERTAGQDWVFRGEPTGKQPLRPAAGRTDEHPGAARKRRFDPEDEKRALERFKSDALPYLGYAPPRDHHLEWLAIAQHHGMQTRLLDWTESVLIAAFFAVEGVGNGMAVIYGVRALPVVDVSTDPFKLTEISLFRPSHITARVAPQLSTFTVHPQPTRDFRDDPRVERWLLPGRKNHWNIKVVLDACGINYASIFPDLGGLARHIYWRYKWGMRQTKSG